MEDAPKLITDMTREELEEHCVILQIECEHLEEENEKLVEVANNLIDVAKKNGDVAEAYQEMFRQIFEYIKAEYDAEFKIEDIPNLKS